MAIIKPVILEGGQLKTAGVGDQVPQAFVQGLDTSLETKVDKVVGKQLSDTNFSQDEKTKLAGLDAALESKVDKVVGKQLSDENFTLIEKQKLSGVAVEATKNRADNENADKEHTHTISQVTGLVDSLDHKVDKQSGKGLSDANFTQAEKDKLSSLESSKFVGLFVSESALPLSGSEGDYANVDGGVGSDVYRVIWDYSDSRWVRLQGASADLTDAQIKQQYENNPDTNAFTDDEKAKLSGVASGATVNRSDTLNADKAHTHTVEQVDGLAAALEVKVDKVTGKGLSESDYTAAEKTKLAGISVEATKNRADSENADKVHTHTWGQVTGAPAQATRWPTFAEVTGKPTTFAPSAHTHPWAEVTGQPATATRWPTFAEVTGKPTTFAPSRSTDTVEGGIKTRVSGDTLWMTNNGNNA